MEPDNKPGGETLIPSDSELMNRLNAGDMSALEVIYMRYSTMVRTAIHRVSPTVISADVDELTQDIFLALVKSAPNYNSTKRLKPWLYGISVNQAAGFKRTGWLHRNLLTRHQKDTEATTVSTADSPAHQLEVRQQLEQAFAGLPGEQHDVMVLHAVEGFKGEEIASILGIEVNTVWTRLHRARKTLRKNLKPRKGALREITRAGNDEK